MRKRGAVIGARNTEAATLRSGSPKPCRLSAWPMNSKPPDAQALDQAGHDGALVLGVEIDEHVAQEDHVVAADVVGQRPHQVEFAKAHPLAQVLGEAKGALRGHRYRAGSGA
jgi:hypothetical protein